MYKDVVVTYFLTQVEKWLCVT